jgi:hypothetical protein
MTPPPKNTQRNGRRRSPRTDLWRVVPPPPEAQTFAPVVDPTALVRSLGPPPLPGQTTYAEHYLVAVVERAAAMAGAVAAAAGVSAEPDND